MAREKWEQKCNRCGLCCHEKVIVGNQIIYNLDEYCQYYDVKTHQCTIYLERLEKNARCKRITRFRAMFAAYLPETCAYVQWAKSHRIRFAPNRQIRYARSSLSGCDDEDIPASLN
ncbi:MAG: hypothetical protein WC224_04340 [Sphaerochaetaceae bacterium]